MDDIRKALKLQFNFRGSVEGKIPKTTIPPVIDCDDYDAEAALVLGIESGDINS